MMKMMERQWSNNKSYLLLLQTVRSFACLGDMLNAGEGCEAAVPAGAR